jgi:hypothetical protein
MVKIERNVFIGCTVLDEDGSVSITNLILIPRNSRLGRVLLWFYFKIPVFMRLKLTNA